MIRYAAQYKVEPDGGFLVLVPSLGPEGITQGDNLEEAREMASDLVSCILTSAVLDHDKADIHLGDSKLPEGFEWVYPEQKVVAAISVRSMRKAAGLSMQEAADRLNVTKSAYQKWENPEKCNAKIETLEKIAKAFSRQFTIEFSPAHA